MIGPGRVGLIDHQYHWTGKRPATPHIMTTAVLHPVGVLSGVARRGAIYRPNPEAE